MASSTCHHRLHCTGMSRLLHQMRAPARWLVALLLLVIPTTFAAKNTGSAVGGLAVDPNAQLPPLEGPTELQVKPYFRCLVTAAAQEESQLTGTCMYMV